MRYNPTFLKRDPATGLNFYDFDGHIHAKGLDFGTGGGQLPEQNIAWVRTVNALSNAGLIRTWSENQGQTERATMDIQSRAANKSSGIQLNSNDPSNGDSVTVNAAGQARTVLDSAGNSGFAQGYSIGGNPLTTRISGRYVVDLGGRTGNFAIYPTFNTPFSMDNAVVFGGPNWDATGVNGSGSGQGDSWVEQVKWAWGRTGQFQFQVKVELDATGTIANWARMFFAVIHY
jgi:hypothetical protein